MHVKPRSYLTAGIATLGVGAIALAPVQPIPDQLTGPPERMVNTLAVSLAAAVDPIQAWVDTFETTFANIGILGEFYMQKPFPLLQTIAANTATYAEEAANGQGDLILGQIWENIQTFFNAPWDPGTTADLSPVWNPDSVATVPTGSLLSQTQLPPPPQQPDAGFPLNPSELNLLLLQFVAGVSVDSLPTPETEALWDQIVSPISGIWRLLETPYSGQLLGLLGPVLSPLVSLTNSFTAIGAAFQAGEVLDAFYELVNIPANMTNAALNGGEFLDLTGIIGSFIDIPELFDGAKFGVNLGGLLNAVPLDGALQPPLVDPDNPPTTYASGVAFDSVSILCADKDAACYDFLGNQPVPGIPNGWLGSTIGLGQLVAEQMLVTPPAPTATSSAAVEAPAPVVEAPAIEAVETPAAVEALGDSEAPVADISVPAVPAELAEDPAPAVEDIAEIEAAIEAVAEVDAAIEAVKASAAEPAEAATPAAEDSGPEAADDDKSDDDTDRSGSKNRRGAN